MSFDLYADENAPTSRKMSETYRIDVGGDLRYNERPVVYVRVDIDSDYVEIDQATSWFGDKPSYVDTGRSRNYFSLMQEIHQYLVEWEFCEWRAIGPEDRELFATDKLVGEHR